MALLNAVSIALVAAIVTTVGFGEVHADQTFAAGDASAFNPVTPRDAAAGTPVQLRTADGLALGAHLYGGGDTGVILAHQYNGDQTGWTDFAMILAAHGYCALTFDFRGFPESGLVVHVPDSPVDLKAAYDFMRPRMKHLFIAGASMGADAAVALASQYPVTGLILLSTPVEFGGLNVYDADAQVKAPLLFVETTDDPFVAGNSAILYKHATAKKSLKIYSGHEHGTEILRGAHGAELRNLMLQFIADHSR
jgi:esterase/lipase